MCKGCKGCDEKQTILEIANMLQHASALLLQLVIQDKKSEPIETIEVPEVPAEILALAGEVA